MKWNKVLEANGIDVDLEDNEPSKLSYKKFEQYMCFLEEVAIMTNAGPTRALTTTPITWMMALVALDPLWD